MSAENIKVIYRCDGCYKATTDSLFNSGWITVTGGKYVRTHNYADHVPRHYCIPCSAKMANALGPER